MPTRILFTINGETLRTIASAALLERLPQIGDDDMATPAKAMVTQVEDIGTFIGPGGAIQIDMTVMAIIVGDDNRTFDASIHVIIDPTATLGAMATAIHDAVVSYATGVGYTIAANRMLLPTFTRL